MPADSRATLNEQQQRLDDALADARVVLDVARKAHRRVSSAATESRLANAEAAHVLARRAAVKHRLKMEEAA